MPHPGINLESLLAAIPDAIFVLDWEGRYLDVAPTGTSLLYRPDNELVGRTFHEVLPVDDADLYLGAVRRALASQQVVQLEYVLRIEGIPTWFAATITPAQPDAVVWVARDITDRKRSEKMREVFAWLGGELGRCTQLEDAGSAVLRAADELFGWDCSFIDVFDEVGPLRQLLAYDVIDGERVRVGGSTPAGQVGSLTARALREGAYLILREQAELTGGVFGSGRPSASMLFVPVREGDRYFGVLSVQSYSFRAYTEEDLNLLQTLADYCSGALRRLMAQERSRQTEAALARSEKRFQNLIESISDAVMLVDENAKTTYISPAVTAMLGYTQSDFAQSAPFSRIHPEDVEHVKHLYRTLLKNPNSPEPALVRALHKDGSWRWVEAVGKNLLNEESVGAIVVNFRDVTERVRGEKTREVLTTLGAQLSAAHSPREAGDAVLRAADELFGWDACFIDLISDTGQQVLWIVAYDLIDGQRQEAPLSSMPLVPGPLTQKTMKEGAHLLLREAEAAPKIRFGNSSQVSASLMFVPIRLEGRPIGVVSIQSYTPRAYTHLDLELLQTLADYCGGAMLRLLAEEKRRESEQALVESERRFRALIESISEAILLRDAQGRASYVSPAIERILGYTPEEYAALDPVTFVHPDEIDRQLHLRERVFSTPGIIQTAEFRLQSKQGGWRWVEVTISNRLNDPSIGAVVVHFRDVTERKRSDRMREVFASLGAELSSTVTAQEAARAVLMAADALFGWNAGFIDAVSEDDPSRVNSLAAFDEVEGVRREVPYTKPNKIPGPGTQKALDDGAHLVLRTLEDRISERAFGDRGRRSESLMFAPLRAGAKPAGVISVQSYTPTAYSQDDLNLLQALADYCGGALQRTTAEQRSRRSEEERQRSQRHYRTLIENSSDAVLLMNTEGLVRYASPAVDRITGHTPEEYLALERFGLLHPDDADSANALMTELLKSYGTTVNAELRLRHKNGSWRWVEVVAQNFLADPAVNALVVNMRDVSDRKAAEEQLKHGAYHDALTDLPNRSAFLDQLVRAFGRGERHSEYGYAVLFLDLDRFKLVNDGLGHLMGDKLLIEVAARLQRCLRASDVAARLGGDEFAILLEDVDLPADATRVAERVLAEISAPFLIEGSEIFTSASIGISLSTTGYSSPDEMLRDADTAMYRAKALGKSRYALFDAEMHQRAVAQLQLENDLRRAIERNELVLHYQPIVALETGVVSGFEALVRWIHPDRGMISPADFIPVAEETGMIAPIGWWVLREACRWMRAWQIESSVGRRMSINVNLSGRQFAQLDLVTQIRDVISETGLDPRCLKLEITESAIIENAEASIQMLSQLKALEVQLHVDDFGTGYSSLAYLHRFPIDALKIDRSFIQNLGKSEEALEISRAVIALARNMGMEAIAEGIESREQLDQLRELGCRLGQGFLFSKALPGEQARRLVDRVFRR